MKILFLGDFFFDYESMPEDLESIAKYIEENDYYVVLNLESPLSNDGPQIKKRGPHLASTVYALEVLKRLRVIAVCLANNHMMDYGAGALYKTIELLDEAGILHVGAGSNLEDAIKAKKLQLCGKDIIIQNFGWDVEETIYATENSAGCAPRDENQILKQTADIRSENPQAVIITCMHWGFECNTLPMPADIQLGHDVIDAGSDLIIGHHPHVIQPVEKWNDKEIFYSLGNFYFASERDGFTTHFENEAVENMCDYGAYVVLEIENMKTEKGLIYYNKEDGKSRLQKDEQNIIKDITGVKWTEKEYYEEAVAHKHNITPILGINVEENKKIIEKLYKKYSIAKKIGFIKKCYLGRILFSIAKKIMGKG